MIMTQTMLNRLKHRRSKRRTRAESKRVIELVNDRGDLVGTIEAPVNKYVFGAGRGTVLVNRPPTTTRL